MHRHQLTYHPDDFNAILDNSIFNTFLPISGRKPGRPSMVQERVFTCEECGKVFHKRRKLTAHLKIHRFVILMFDIKFIDGSLSRLIGDLNRLDIVTTATSLCFHCIVLFGHGALKFKEIRNYIGSSCHLSAPYKMYCKNIMFIARIKS